MDGDLIIQHAVAASINNMFRKGWVDVCAIRECADILEVSCDGRAFAVLKSLHCVHFGGMSPELNEQIPALVNEVLFNNPIPSFRVCPKTLTCISTAPQPKRISWLLQKVSG